MYIPLIKHSGTLKCIRMVYIIMNKHVNGTVKVTQVYHNYVAASHYCGSVDNGADELQEGDIGTG